MPSAFICGLSGLELAPSERDFLRDARPCGIILFARNCAEPDQVRRLVADAREALGGDALVLIDQEGGRVRRLRPPHWRELPAAASYAALYGRDPAAAVRAAHLAARLTAADLRDLGININCAPVLDLPQPGSHAIIGDRAYGSDVERIIVLGRAVADGLSAGGVLPVIKHIPGHGRATKDSHHDLPVVDADRAVLDATDFAPFRALADLPAAMTAHVVYTAVDPSAPASASATVIGDVVRGAIGFQGLLMCDDLSMQALAG
ncbi:MAG: beta-N-acetylhexosaminidase, partial [Hyphomicrobiaceae bacterium]